MATELRWSEQSREALRSANEIRVAQARLKEAIKAEGDGGRLLVAGLLDGFDGEHVLGSIRLRVVLDAIHRFGQQRVLICLRRSGLSSGERRVRELTSRERRAIASWLRDET